MPNSELKKTTVENVKPKFLEGRASNFVRAKDNQNSSNFNESPMMLTAWTQTTADDFNIFYENALAIKEQEFRKREHELLQRIELLEQSTRKQTEVLTQIHASTISTLHLPVMPVQHRTSGLGSVPEQQQQQQLMLLPNIISQSEQQHHEENARYYASYTTTIPAATAQSNNTVITTLNAMSTQVTHSPMIVTPSYKYTIVQENEVNADEPMQLQLSQSEDDVGTNLNSSADSTRLAICLEENDNSIKTENESQQCACMSQTKVEPSSSEYSNSSKNHLECKQKMATKRKVLSPIDTSSVYVSLGPKETRIPACVYENINWDNASIATRKLLVAAFDRTTLATHTMTGKPSPAFSNKPVKRMLDQDIVSDIIYAVTRRSNVSEKEVRNAITTKCADENKMLKLRECRKRISIYDNKENININTNNNKTIP